MYPASAGLRVVSLARTLVAEQIEYRELLVQMVKRDLLLRYKQTVMGFGWAVFMPLVNTVIFSIVFTRVAHVDTGLPYPLYAYCGLLAWNFTASSLRFAVVSLTGNANLVTKIYFPREIFPFSAVLVSLVDFAVGSILLVGLMAYYRIVPNGAIAALPLVLLVHIMLTLSLSLVLAMANLFYRDVKYIFELVLNVWMFASAIVYPVDAIGGVAGMVIRANPMTAVVEAYRHVLLYGTPPDPLSFGSAAILSVVLLPTTWVVFHRSEFRFAENI